MEYARGRLFKDPSLPGVTAEERKVRVERVGGGEFIRELIQWNEGPVQGTGKICSL